jgi:hypothetical protein
MATLIVPTDDTGARLFWSQTTTLDGVAYLLTFRFNTREQCYYLTIESADGATNYAQGIKLVANYPLLKGFATPPGEFVVASFDPSNDSPPKVGELGNNLRCEMFYIEEDDLIFSGLEPWRNPFLGLPAGSD